MRLGVMWICDITSSGGGLCCLCRLSIPGLGWRHSTTHDRLPSMVGVLVIEGLGKACGNVDE